MTTSAPQTTGFSRTVVFIKYASQYGQQVFVRGGIGHDRRPRMYSHKFCNVVSFHLTIFIALYICFLIKILVCACYL